MTPLLAFIVVMVIVAGTLFFIAGRMRFAPEWYNEARPAPRSQRGPGRASSAITGTTPVYDAPPGKPFFRPNERAERKNASAPVAAGITIDRLDLLLEIQEFLQEAFPSSIVKRTPRHAGGPDPRAEADLRNENPWAAEVFFIEVRNFGTYQLAFTDEFLDSESSASVIAFLKEHHVAEALESGRGEACLWVGRSGIHARALQLGPVE